MNTALQLVGIWIRESKPTPALPIPHDCIMDAYGVECQKCEEMLEWNACVKEEWIDEFCPFFATASEARDTMRSCRVMRAGRD